MQRPRRTACGVSGRIARAAATAARDQARGFYGMEPGADRMVALTSFLLVGGLAETLIAWMNGAIETTRDQLIEDCTDLFVATGEAAVALARRS